MCTCTLFYFKSFTIWHKKSDRADLDISARTTTCTGFYKSERDLIVLYSPLLLHSQEIFRNTDLFLLFDLQGERTHLKNPWHLQPPISKMRSRTRRTHRHLMKMILLYSKLMYCFFPEYLTLIFTYCLYLLLFNSF